MVAGLLSMAAYVTLLQWRTRPAVCFLIAITLVNVFTALAAGSIPWILGIWLLCPSPIIAFLSLVVLFAKWKASWRAFKDNTRRSNLYLFGGLLIVALQLSPIIGFWGVDKVCSTVARNQSSDVIMALENYRQDKGHYPTEPKVLVPTYLQALPFSVCGQELDLVHCQSGDTLLVFSSTNNLGTHRYNLKTKQWSVIDTLDFDLCDYTE